MTKKVLIAAIAVFSFASSPAQNYFLDTDYGTSGKTITEFSFGNVEMATMAIQPDGKVIACGTYIYDLPLITLHDIALARFNTDGTPDETFGTNGQTYVLIEGLNEGYHNVVKVMDDGKILILATTFSANVTYNYLLVRRNADGSPDPTFGTDGKVEIDFDNASDKSVAMEIQPDGKIVIAGSSATSASGNDEYDFCVSRLNADGTKDTAFGVNGLAKINFGSGTNFSVWSEDQIFDILLQPDGKIVATGFTAQAAETAKFAVLRLNDDGTPDATFGNEGRVITDFTSDDEVAQSIVLMPDGKLIATGIHYYNDDDNEQVALAKYNTDGSLDTSFGVMGTTILDDGNPNPRNFAFSSLATADGKLLVCGGGRNLLPNFDGFLLRVNADGTLDTELGGNGWVWSDFGQWEVVRDMVMQDDGRIVLGGTASFDKNRFIVWRYETPEMATTDFSTSAYAVTPNPFTNYIDIRSSLMEHKTVSIDLLDISGRQITAVLSDDFLTGNHSVRLNLPETLPNGIYFLKINDTKNSTTVKILK